MQSVASVVSGLHLTVEGSVRSPDNTVASGPLIKPVVQLIQTAGGKDVVYGEIVGLQVDERTVSGNRREHPEGANAVAVHLQVGNFQAIRPGDNLLNKRTRRIRFQDGGRTSCCIAYCGFATTLYPGSRAGDGNGGTCAKQQLRALQLQVRRGA